MSSINYKIREFVKLLGAPLLVIAQHIVCSVIYVQILSTYHTDSHLSVISLRPWTSIALGALPASTVVLSVILPGLQAYKHLV